MTLVDRLSVGPPPAADPTGPDLALGELRGVLGRFATGVTVLTTGRDTPQGMTANSFTSVSLEPPMILVCVKRTAALHDAILTEKAFAVSVLAGHQQDVAKYFADRGRPRGSREFETVDSTPGQHTGAPVLTDAQAWLECGLAAVYDGGDHSIFLGSVLDIGRRETDDPLLYFGGGFHQLPA
ncbi:MULTISPECIES: flavin reductase family protein [unclassified Streptomyces]|uniref:flavin reductase family protein n=1 Tax=unclassified Streptomyces TaxID=2593676 RepID=UPI00037A35C3|nr:MULTISPECIES: flavin reductase family protein [unclassified Streptomyces]MYQ76822.1 flavin reductase [Streptomyces sp. SID4923]OKI91995.1 flavin reductase [Streptomyces sp. CB01249]